MACCGLDKDKPLWIVVLVVVAVLVAAVGGCAIALILSPFSRRARRSLKVIALFIGATSTELRERVLEHTCIVSPRFRCAVSGSVMKLSPRLAGFVHKRLGSILLATIAALIVGCWILLRLAMSAG